MLFFMMKFYMCSYKKIEPSLVGRMCSCNEVLLVVLQKIELSLLVGCARVFPLKVKAYP